MQLLAVEQTNHLFLSYLLVDLCHIIAKFPTLVRGPGLKVSTPAQTKHPGWYLEFEFQTTQGGADMLAHHGLFIFCAAACGGCRVLGFAFGWLIIGEVRQCLSVVFPLPSWLRQCLFLADFQASTVLLGVRWLLINTGRGGSAAMAVANACFALTFFITRVVIYGLGLAELALQLADRAGTPIRDTSCCCHPLTDVPYLLPGPRSEGRAEAFGSLDALVEPAVWVVLVLLLGGMLLNLMWFKSIMSIALGGKKKKKVQ